MRDEALYQATIDILDLYLSRFKLEAALKYWSNKNRFAGSSDRRHIRNIIFDIIRQKNSCAFVGGGLSGRQLVMGYLILEDIDLSSVFTGLNYAPKEITKSERRFLIFSYDVKKVYELDCPTWLIPIIKNSLSGNFSNYLNLMRSRALVQLRINKQKTCRESVLNALKNEKIEVAPNNLVSSGINVLNGAHKILRSSAFLNGLIEFQDVGSQLVSQLIQIEEGDQVLDLCAGSGGKTLAVASETNKVAYYSAWDEDFNRMDDLENRANRAGIKINKLLNKPAQNIFDKVIIDAPCSGSGSWRRSPQGKWDLSLDKLSRYIDIQKRLILDGFKLLKPGGQVIYITCSVLDIENEKVIDELILAEGTFYEEKIFNLLPTIQNDGFFAAILRKK